MMIYFGIIIGLVFLNVLMHPLNTSVKKKKFLIISFVVLSLIASIRDKSVGVDTYQYYKNFKVINSLTFSEFDYFRYEYGFMILCKILNCITQNPQILLITTSLFINFSVMRFIYLNSKNVSFSIYIYILLNYYFSYMNVMRQAVAIAIILLFFESLKKNQNIKFAIGTIIASFFHFSAIICLSFIVIKKIKYKKIYKYLIMLLFVLLFIFGRDLFVILGKYSDRISVYIGSEFDTSNYFGALINFMVSISILFFGVLVNKYDMEKKDVQEWIFYFKIMICYSALTLLEMKVSIFNRLTPYFSIFALVWISNSLLKIKKSKYRLLMNVFVFVFMFMYWLIILIYRPNWYGAVPYQIFK